MSSGSNPPFMIKSPDGHPFDRFLEDCRQHYSFKCVVYTMLKDLKPLQSMLWNTVDIEEINRTCDIFNKIFQLFLSCLNVIFLSDNIDHTYIDSLVLARRLNI